MGRRRRSGHIPNRPCRTGICEKWNNMVDAPLDQSPATPVPPGDDLIASLPLRPLGRGFDLLDGVRVIDLTTSVAGPSATMLLADMGAEVLKIERPAGGDDARAWGPPFLDGESLWFMSVNRNKKSIALDYSRPEGLDVLRRL